MPKDRNPNNVSKDEVDKLFLAHVGELAGRRGKAKKDSSQIREANLLKASEIVKKAEDKKKGKK